MKRLIVFGCSLTAWGAKRCWAEELSRQTNLEMVNLAVPGGSNQLQVKRFQEFILHNNITQDDVVIWQVTGVDRAHKRTKTSIVPRILDMLNPEPGTVVNSVNILDDTQRIDYLFWHKECKDAVVDSAEVLQDLLFCFKTIKQFTNKLLVIKGWDGAVPKEFRGNFNRYLEKNNIDYLDQSILAYAIENNLPLQDDLHPDEAAYIDFANNCVKIKITELGWV